MVYAVSRNRLRYSVSVPLYVCTDMSLSLHTASHKHVMSLSVFSFSYFSTVHSSKSGDLT